MISKSHIPLETEIQSLKGFLGPSTSACLSAPRKKLLIHCCAVYFLTQVFHATCSVLCPWKLQNPYFWQTMTITTDSWKQSRTGDRIYPVVERRCVQWPGDTYTQHGAERFAADQPHCCSLDQHYSVISSSHIWPRQPICVLHSPVMRFQHLLLLSTRGIYTVEPSSSFRINKYK